MNEKCHLVDRYLNCLRPSSKIGTKFMLALQEQQQALAHLLECKRCLTGMSTSQIGEILSGLEDSKEMSS